MGSRRVTRARRVGPELPSCSKPGCEEERARLGANLGETGESGEEALGPLGQGWADKPQAFTALPDRPKMPWKKGEQGHGPGPHLPPCPTLVRRSGQLTNATHSLSASPGCPAQFFKGSTRLTPLPVVVNGAVQRRALEPDCRRSAGGHVDDWRPISPEAVPGGEED